MSAHLGGAYIGPAHVTTGEDDDTYWWAEVLLENVQTDEWGTFQGKESVSRSLYQIS